MNKSSFFIVGKHAVIEALKNPNRKVLRVFLTEETKKTIHRENQTNNLLKDIKYSRELNAKLQYEVSRPRYASMGAIARNEGFIMPMGKENIRTKFLGNSSPKLLKFKEKRNDN